MKSDKKTVWSRITATPAGQAVFAAAVITLFSAVTYANSVGCSFHFDDFYQFVENYNTRALDSIPRFFSDATIGTATAGLKGYRPITYSSFVLNYAVSGLSVWSWHLANLLLHIANALMLFLIAGKALRGRGGLWLPLFISLAFALHPVQTGSVTYISGRAALLASFFVLSALYCFINYRENGGWINAVLPPCLLVAGLLSKEIAVCFIGFAVIYDILFSLPETGWKKSPKLLTAYLPLIAALGLFILAKAKVAGYMATGEVDHTVPQYLMSEAKALLIYLRVLFLPVNLNADYDMSATTAPDGLVWAGAAVFAVYIAFVMWLAKRDKAAAFFGAWFAVCILPESSFFPITDIVVEYRLYLALAGIAGMVAVLASRVNVKRQYRRAFCAVLVALFCILSISRNRVWADELSFWTDIQKKSPYSARAEANLGNALLDAGQYMAAINHFNRSIEINPFYDQSYNLFNNLGLCFLKLDMPQDSVEHFERALKVDPAFIKAYSNLGAAYSMMGRYGDAIRVLEQAQQIGTGDNNLLINLSQAYKATGRIADARKALEDAERYARDDAERQSAVSLMGELADGHGGGPDGR
ncbi:MAG TPA: tetratricopeptide repeat protein [Nitrospirota bacterium]|jgi:tetratricopeptide (TPR) repeat protein